MRWMTINEHGCKYEWPNNGNNDNNNNSNSNNSISNDNNDNKTLNLFRRNF